MKAVLTYHSVDDSNSVISVTRTQLANQLDQILSAGVSVVPFEKILSLPDDSHAVALTFDDGFSNFVSTALPVLRDRDLPATLFIVAGYAGSSNDWESGDSRAPVPSARLMSWDELRSIDQSITLGAHGLSHRSLKGMGSDELERELTGCLSQMQNELGVAPSSFAFPYGDVDQNASLAVARHFEYACTTDFALVTRKSKRHAVPRLDSFYFRDNSMLEKFGSREFAAWVQMRSAARRARRSLLGNR